MAEKIIENALPDEQAAELRALERGAFEGNAEDIAEAETAIQEQQQAGANLAGELKGLVLAFVGMVGPVFPSLPKIYTPEATEAAANAVSAVCLKHGWLQGGIMGEYAEEITAAVVLLPLGLATYKGMQADIQEARKKDRVAVHEGAREGTAGVLERENG